MTNTKEPFPITVIVPVYNGAKFLDQCLTALQSSDYANFDVLVIDDGSTDDSAELARSKGAFVLPSERRQSGPAAARNLAAKVARGDILLFVDADVVVKHDTISKVAAAFEQHPEISAVFGSYDNEPAEQNFLSQYKNLQHHYVHQSSSSEASTFWAGLGAVRRNVFNELGGFDSEQFRQPSIEDIELGVRLRQDGHKIRLDKNIQAKHLKKWKALGLLRTEIFCRAVPWSKLILTQQGMINDMNLKTLDRISALLVALIVLSLPLVVWNLYFGFLVLALSLAVVVLNWRTFMFFARTKGPLFAVMTFPWLLIYYLYSGSSFVFCWLRYGIPLFISSIRRENLNLRN